MAENDHFNNSKFKFIIFHGYIHIIPINEETEDNDEILDQDF
jgi:hypothetical protein